MTDAPDTATSAPLSILHVFRAPVGGLFRHVYDVVKAQVAAGHKVGIICDSMTGGARGETLLAELTPLLVHGIHRTPMHRIPHLSDYKAVALLRHVMKNTNADVLHGHGAKGGFYARLGRMTAAHKVISAYTPHGGSLNYHPGSAGHRFFMKVELALELGTDLFLFESAFIRDRYYEYVCESKKATRIALNGLYPHEFTAVEPAEDATDFLYVGEFREAKGIDTLVEAIFQLVQAGHRPSITMVGSGPSEASIRSRIAAHGIADLFRWRGVTPAIEAFRLGKVMVVPSRFESLPYIVLEAAAGALPLISTDVGGIPEILHRDYHYLIPPNSPDRLAAAMQEALERPFSDLKADAGALSARVNGHFRVDLMVDTILGGYHEARQRRGIAAQPASSPMVNHLLTQTR